MFFSEFVLRVTFCVESELCQESECVTIWQRHLMMIVLYSPEYHSCSMTPAPHMVTSLGVSISDWSFELRDADCCPLIGHIVLGWFSICQGGENAHRVTRALQ